MDPLTITCFRCDGSGIEPTNAGLACWRCKGSGLSTAKDIYSDILHRVINITPSTGIFHSHEILECLDATEHAALTDTQQDGVFHILACVRVDLNDGKVGKTRLWNWFGAGSTTVANLTALLD